MKTSLDVAFTQEKVAITFVATTVAGADTAAGKEKADESVYHLELRPWGGIDTAKCRANVADKVFVVFIFVITPQPECVTYPFGCV